MLKLILKKCGVIPIGLIWFRMGRNQRYDFVQTPDTSSAAKIAINTLYHGDEQRCRTEYIHYIILRLRKEARP